MAGSLSNFAEALVLDWLLTTGAATRPTAWYLALFTADPGEASGGTEVTGGAYARKAVTFTRSGTAPTQAANNANIEFDTATANWGTISHAAVFDASTGGNMLAYGEVLNPVTGLADPQAINTGNIFRYNSGDFKVTQD
jgi:hypothetical protein